MTPCICRPNNASKSGSTVLELSHISQRYGRKVVLNDVSQDFGPGVTVITGPSGAGKTTLLRICASAEKPSAGTISWQGKSVASQKRRFRAVLGYAPQRIDFPEDISAMDFLLHIAALKSIGRAQAKTQAEALLGRLGLARDAGGKIRTFSGGMRRRLGLAQACLGTPEILIFDEPTAELDPVTAGHVHDLIFDYAAQGATILMTTHLTAGLAGRPYETFHISAELEPVAAS